MNKILQEDIKAFADSFALSEQLIGARFLITGATGLIGSTLVRCLLALDRKVKITCPVRSRSKAELLFSDCVDKIRIIECDLLTYLNSIESKDKFQYVVHCASPTSGLYMTEHPVETFAFTIDSTKQLLELSRKSGVKSIVYVSSLEFYGQNDNDDVITEGFQGYLDTQSPRSSYPLGKRAAEYLCTAYALEYGVPVKIARLTQTFGAGISPDDNRVFAQFARSVISNTDIVLHTTGDSAKPYCYTIDSISAILYILIKGENGNAYNVANDDTYISIKEMADFICLSFNQRIRVIVEEHPELGYAPVTRLNLSTEKLRSLGWRPSYGLYTMFERLLMSLS